LDAFKRQKQQENKNEIKNFFEGLEAVKFFMALNNGGVSKNPLIVGCAM
jgi:hypothetical protein